MWATNRVDIAKNKWLIWTNHTLLFWMVFSHFQSGNPTEMGLQHVFFDMLGSGSAVIQIGRGCFKSIVDPKLRNAGFIQTFFRRISTSKGWRTGNHVGFIEGKDFEVSAKILVIFKALGNSQGNSTSRGGWLWERRPGETGKEEEAERAQRAQSFQRAQKRRENRERSGRISRAPKKVAEVVRRSGRYSGWAECCQRARAHRNHPKWARAFHEWNWSWDQETRCNRARNAWLTWTNARSIGGWQDKKGTQRRGKEGQNRAKGCREDCRSRWRWASKKGSRKREEEG